MAEKAEGVSPNSYVDVGIRTPGITPCSRPTGLLLYPTPLAQFIQSCPLPFTLSFKKSAFSSRWLKKVTPEFPPGSL